MSPSYNWQIIQDLFSAKILKALEERSKLVTMNLRKIKTRTTFEPHSAGQTAKVAARSWH